MFAPRSLYRRSLQAACRHPWLSVGIAFLLCGTSAMVGAWAWGRWQVRAAEQDLRAERWDEARRHIRRCLSVWPWSSNASAHLLAARIERRSGHFAEAEAALKESKGLRGDSDEAIQLEWLLLRAERGDVDALFPGLWRYVTEGRPEAPLILETLAGIYLRSERPRPALTCLDAWLKLDPDNARALEWRGRMENVLDEPAAAARDFRRALELEPERYESRRQLAEILLGQAKAEEALPHLEYLRKAHPDRPEVMAALAQYQDLLGRANEARQILRKVLEAHPDQRQALFLRGKVELECRQAQEAEKWLRRALVEDPGNLQALQELHRCLQQQPGRAHEAAAVLARHDRMAKDCQRLRQLLRAEGDQDLTNPLLLLEIGRLALATGRERLGLQRLNLALKWDPNLRAAHRVLAEYYETKGHLQEAAAQWWQAIGVQPDKR